MRLILLLLLLVSPAAAQPASAPAQAAAGTPEVTAAQARNAIAVLRDDKQRAALISTLEAIAQAGPAAEQTPAAPAAPAEAPAKAAAPAQATLTPNSVGVRLAGRLATVLSAYGQKLAGTLRSVNDLPRLADWLRTQSQNPAVRQAVGPAALRVALVLAVALLAEFLVRWLLRRARLALSARAPGHADVGDLSTRPAEEARRRRFDRALAGLRQVPFLLGRLVLELVPAAVFLGVSELMLGLPIGTQYVTRVVTSEVVQSYLYARVILAVGALLFAADAPRLLAVTRETAAFLQGWLRLLTIIAVTGIAVAHIGALFGMDPASRFAVLKLFALLVHAGLVVMVLQSRSSVAAWLRGRGSGRWGSLLDRFAGSWHLVAIFVTVSLWLVWAVELQNGYRRLLVFTATTLAVVGGARLCAVLLLGALERVRSALGPDGAGRFARYFPVLHALIGVALWVVGGVVLLEAWGVPIVFWVTAGGLGGQVLQALGTVVVAVVLAVVAWEAFNAAMERHLVRLAGSAQVARAGRLRTLLPLLRTTLLIAILLVVGMVVLSAIGVNIAPLLAGAGVLGIAVGFGSQKLVQDLITGLFLLLENAMQVGDVVTVGGLTGTVEALSIRTIRLRALDGAVHLIPFSAVTTVTNLTRDYSYAVVDVSVGLNEEPGPIEKVLQEVAAQMQEDPEWQSMVLAKLDVMGVEKLTDAAWILRVRMKTQPGSRWAVARELNRRIKLRFDELAIQSPFTSQKVLAREAAAAAAAEQGAEQAA